MSLQGQKFREIAMLVIDQHMRQGPCLFSPTAVDDIAAAACAAADASGDVIWALVRAIEDAEIYCPHEGIDRRAEFGIRIVGAGEPRCAVAAAGSNPNI